MHGPFHALDNSWRFDPHGDNGARVRFSITYQFKNPVLNALVAANKDTLSDRIMNSFEKEARRFEELTRGEHALKVSAAYDGMEIDV